MKETRSITIKGHKFTARMVDNGKVIKTGSIEIDMPEKDHSKARDAAYKEAHKGIDPYSGVWVEIRPATV